MQKNKMTKLQRIKASAKKMRYIATDIDYATILGMIDNYEIMLQIIKRSKFKKTESGDDEYGRLRNVYGNKLQGNLYVGSIPWLYKNPTLIISEFKVFNSETKTNDYKYNLDLIDHPRNKDSVLRIKINKSKLKVPQTFDVLITQLLKELKKRKERIETDGFQCTRFGNQSHLPIGWKNVEKRACNIAADVSANLSIAGGDLSDVFTADPSLSIYGPTLDEPIRTELTCVLDKYWSWEPLTEEARIQWGDGILPPCSEILAKSHKDVTLVEYKIVDEILFKDHEKSPIQILKEVNKMAQINGPIFNPVRKE